jgi:hypothetical protein
MNAINTTSTTPSTPSIASSAVLVELSISTWTGRKLDKTVSNEVTVAKHAQKGTATVNKKILGDCAELDAVQKFAANVRNCHYALTMPWSDTGLRLLTTKNFFAYQTQLTALQAEFSTLTDKFLTAYGWEVGQAQVRLGSLFNANDYPSADKIRDKFRFAINYMPVPEAGDFRLDINNEAQQQIAQHYANYYQAQLKTAMADIWERARDALGKMSERLDYADHNVKKIFRDSLVDNVLEVVDLMESCNLTGDPEMTRVQKLLRSTLSGVSPDALRKDEWLRLSTKQQIDDAIKALPSLGF